ncbi:EF-hand [Laetiporus sulphureus 93-53]|uniref:EF-hand n=1 Tax=Laetiporus sulphureus 93-53 TaxID=1314785 RepID=A0A165CW15_9APHY|nr:EF-hand [Laetiporus sulphureus 93-53]KZT03547.1 EF-hand [Laetiporus sulphureus 93-53]
MRALPERRPIWLALTPEDVKHIYTLCKAAQGNADLLREALVNANGPQDLRNGLTREFLDKCRKSQLLVEAQTTRVASVLNNPRLAAPGPHLDDATRTLKVLRGVNDDLIAAMQFYSDLVYAGLDKAEQERIKNEHTIRMLTATTSLSALSLDGGRTTSHRPPPSPGAGPSNLDDEKIQRLSKVAKTAMGNAELLRESLLHAQPEDLSGAIVQEFMQSCLDSQKAIFEHIQWADAAAASSRRRVGANDPSQTREELLFKELITADEVLTEVLKMLDELRLNGVPVETQSAMGKPSISADPEAEKRRLPELCRVGRGNAELLSEALMHATREDLHGELIQEFNASCRTSQKEIITAVAQIELSSDEAASSEENILGKLIAANEVLIEALRHYDELSHTGAVTSVPQEVQSEKGKAPMVSIFPQAYPITQPEAGPSRPPMISMAQLPPLTQEDKAKFMKIFFGAGPKNGFLSGARARDLLLKSRLPSETLLQIWDLADVSCRGSLAIGDFVIAMYLVQACMTGRLAPLPSALPPELYQQAGCNAIFSPARLAIPGPSLTTTPNLQTSPALPGAPAYFGIQPTAQDHTDRIFQTLDTEGTGKVQSYVIMSFLLKLGLSMDVLNQIWSTADTGSKGYLTRAEFAIAMKLAEMKKAGQELPASPSSSEVEQASSSAAPQPTVPEASLIDLDEPLGGPSTPRPPVAEVSGPNSDLLAVNTLIVPPQLTGSAFFEPSSPQPTSPLPQPSSPEQMPNGSVQPWAINPVVKARFDTFFDTLDPWRKGYIEGDIAVTFFAKSKLPDNVMADIWDLADVNHDGRLTRDEFAIAMQLIRETIKGKELPSQLPPSLIPPSLQSSPPSQLPPRESPQGGSTRARSAAGNGRDASRHREPARQSSGTTSAPPSFDEIAPRPETPPPPYEAVVSTPS